MITSRLNKHRQLSIFLVLLYAVLASCSGDSEPPAPPVSKEAPKIAGLIVDDISNNGNGSDFEVSFSRADDESLVLEYRILVVKKDNNESFTLSDAEEVLSENYLKLEPTGQDKKIVLGESAVDVDGELIVEDIEYVVYVLSVADGTNATENSLSSASKVITLMVTSIKITYIGNDGVHISDGEKAVIIDALPSTLVPTWNPLAGGLQSTIESSMEPFADIKISAITHAHGDHMSVNSSSSFLANNTSATLLAPPQVVNLGISGTANQIADLDLAIGERKDTVIAEIPISILRIRHFIPQDNSDFSGVESYAYLVELGGLKILHIGDGDLSVENFEGFNLKDEGIDAAIIPTFEFSGQLVQAKKEVLESQINPDHIVGVHLMQTTQASSVISIYPNAFVFTQSLDFIRL